VYQVTLFFIFLYRFLIKKLNPNSGAKHCCLDLVFIWHS